jgi:hypothetical protein
LTNWNELIASETRRFVKKAPNFVKKIAQNGASLNYLPQKITDQIKEI